jgi:hypothetical protein
MPSQRERDDHGDDEQHQSCCERTQHEGIAATLSGARVSRNEEVEKGVDDEGAYARPSQPFNLSLLLRTTRSGQSTLMSGPRVISAAD